MNNKVKKIGFGYPYLLSDGNSFIEVVESKLNELVKDREDIKEILFFNHNYIDKFDITKYSKRLMFSGENILNVPRFTPKNKILNFIVKILFKIDVRFEDIICKLFNKFQHISHIQANKFYNDIIKNKTNDFIIIGNKSNHPNVLVVPHFVATSYKKLSRFEEIKKSNLIPYKEKKFCAFLVSNSYAKERINLFLKLSKYKQIDSFGKVFNNAIIPERLIKKYNGEDKFYQSNELNQELLSEYKFVLCYENTYYEEYVTEKLPNAMLAGSIGIYKGPKNINKFFNTKSFINFYDFKNEDDMIDYIISLDKDEEKYNKVIEQPLFSENFLYDINKMPIDDYLKRFINAK